MARQLVNKEYLDRDIVVMFGRLFIANPDLIFRIQRGLKLTRHVRETFYEHKSPKGYLVSTPERLFILPLCMSQSYELPTCAYFALFDHAARKNLMNYCYKWTVLISS
jgi:hypothetical protein